MKTISSDHDDKLSDDEGIVPQPSIPRETFISKNGQIEWSSSLNMRWGTISAANIIKAVPGLIRMAVTHITDIKSAFELVIPDSIQKIVLEITNLERRCVFGQVWRELDETHLHAYLGLLILAGVYKSKDESTAGLWDADRQGHIPSHRVQKGGCTYPTSVCVCELGDQDVQKDKLLYHSN